MKTETKNNVSSSTGFISNIRLFNKIVWLNLLAWFVLQFCFAGIYDVLLNIYLARLGYNIQFIGLVNTAGGLGFAIFAIPAGLLGTRYGYRKMVILGFIGGVLFPTLLMLSRFFGPGMQHVSIIASYGLYSIAMTFIAVNGITFLANAATDSSRVHVFSVYGAIAPLAGFCGSIVAGFMPKVIAELSHTSLDKAMPYLVPLWIVPLLFLVFLLLFTFLTNKNKNSAGPDAQGLEPQKSKEKPPVMLFGTMFLLTVLRISSFYALFVYFNIYLDSALKISTDKIGLLTALTRIIPVPVALLTPLLVGKMGKFNLIIWVSFLSAMFALPIGLSSNLIAAAISFIVISGANAIASAAFTPLHQEATPEKWRSLMAGSVFSAEAISFALMAFFGGYIIKSLGYQPFFLVSAVTTMASGVLFWLLLRNKVART